MKSNNKFRNDGIKLKKQMKNEKKNCKKISESKKNQKSIVNRRAKNAFMQSYSESKQESSLFQSSNHSQQQSQSNSNQKHDSKKLKRKSKNEKQSDSYSNCQEQISQPEKYRISYSEGGRQDIQNPKNVNQSDYEDLSKPYRVRFFYRRCKNDPTKVINYKVFQQIEQEPPSASKKSSSIYKGKKKPSINNSISKISIPHKNNDSSDDRSKSNSKQKSTITSNHLSNKSKNISVFKNNSYKLQNKSKSSKFVKDLQKFQYQISPQQKIIQESSSTQSCKLISDQSEITKIKQNITQKQLKKSEKPNGGLKLTKNTKKKLKKRPQDSDSYQNEDFIPQLEKEKKKTKNESKTTKKQKQKKIIITNKKSKPTPIKQKKQKNKQQPNFFDVIKSITPKKQKVSKNKKTQKQISQQNLNKKKQKDEKIIRDNNKDKRVLKTKKIQDKQKGLKRLKKITENINSQTQKNNNQIAYEHLVIMIDDKKEQNFQFFDENLKILNHTQQKVNLNFENITSQPQMELQHYSLALPLKKLENKIISQQHDQISQENMKNLLPKKYELTVQKLSQHEDFTFNKIQERIIAIQNKIVEEPKQSRVKTLPQKRYSEILSLQNNIEKNQKSKLCDSPQYQKKQDKKQQIQKWNSKVDQNLNQVNNQEIDWFEDIFNEFPKREISPSQEIDLLLPLRDRDDNGNMVKLDDLGKRKQVFIDPVFSDDSFMDLLDHKEPQYKQDQQKMQYRFDNKVIDEVILSQKDKIIQEKELDQIFQEDRQNQRLQQARKCSKNNQENNQDKKHELIFEQEKQFQREEGQMNIQGQKGRIIEDGQKNKDQQKVINQSHENVDSEGEQCIINYCISDEQGSQDGQLVIIQRLCTKKKGQPIFFHPLNPAMKKQEKIQYENKLYNHRNQSQDEYQNNQVLKLLKDQFIVNQRYFNFVKKDNKSDCQLSEEEKQMFAKNKHNKQDQSYFQESLSFDQIISQRLKTQFLQKKQHHLKNVQDIKIQGLQQGEIIITSDDSSLQGSQGQMIFNQRNHLILYNTTKNSQSQTVTENKSNFNNQRLDHKTHVQNKAKQNSPQIIEIQSQQSQSGQMTLPQKKSTSPYQIPSYLKTKNQEKNKFNNFKIEQFKQPSYANKNKSTNSFNRNHNKYPQIYSEFPYQTQKNHNNSTFSQNQSNLKCYQQPPNKLNKTQNPQNEDFSTSKRQSETENTHTQIIEKQTQKSQSIQKITPEQKSFLQMLEEFTFRQQKMKQIIKSRIIHLDIVDDDQQAAKKMQQRQIQIQQQQSEDSLAQALQEMQKQVFNYKFYIKTDEMKKK